MRAIPLQFRHPPSFHSFCWICSNKINRQMRRFHRRKPSLIVPWFDDERTTVVEGLQNLIRIRSNDAETFEDDLVLIVVLSFPLLAVIRKRRNLTLCRHSSSMSVKGGAKGNRCGGVKGSQLQDLASRYFGGEGSLERSGRGPSPPRRARRSIRTVMGRVCGGSA